MTITIIVINNLFIILDCKVRDDDKIVRVQGELKNAQNKLELVNDEYIALKSKVLSKRAFNCNVCNNVMVCKDAECQNNQQKCEQSINNLKQYVENTKPTPIVPAPIIPTPIIPMTPPPQPQSSTPPPQPQSSTPPPQPQSSTPPPQPQPSTPPIKTEPEITPKKDNKKYWIIGGVIGGVTLLIIVMTIILVMRKRNKK